MATTRYPVGDSIPDAPELWEPIPLGIGQEPNFYGRSGSFQVQRAVDPRFLSDSIRRNSEEGWQVIVHLPERP